MSKRVIDVIRDHYLASRSNRARALIATGRVWMDGVIVFRPQATVPPGWHDLEVRTSKGAVKIKVRGDDDFRV